MFKNTAQRCYIKVLDADGDGIIDDEDNITAKYQLDSGTATTTNDAKPTQLDDTNFPGIYYFDILDSECNGDRFLIKATSITSGAVIPDYLYYLRPIGFSDAPHHFTTIATLATQTSFTLTAGSTDDDAYNGWVALIQDAATNVQKAVGIVSDYTGSTKTVTLAADPGVFTMAATDIITLVPSLASGHLPTNFSSLGIESDGHAHADVKEWLGTAVAAWSATRGAAGTALPAVAAGGVGGVPVNNASSLVDANVAHVYGDGTAAQNLNTACDNYDADRGLAGTALPGAAADDPGGLPISDAGDLDMDAIFTLATAIDTLTKAAGDGDLAAVKVSTDRLTAARAAVLTDWINGGRLDLLLDAIPTEAMRGTDNAATAAALATTDGKVDTISSNVTTLLGRITATLFSGITSLANWLRMICQKDTANLTALSEINDLGSDSYDNATDSLEAVRDNHATITAPTVGEIDTELSTTHGAGSWEAAGSGSGTNTVTVNVKDDGAANMQGVQVKMQEGINKYLATTNASGNAVFSLDELTFTYGLTKGGYTDDDPGGTVAISSDPQTVNLTMTAIVVAAPSDPTMTTVYLDTADILGEAITNLEVWVTPTASPTVGAAGLLTLRRKMMAHQTDTPGRYQIEIEREVAYEAECLALWDSPQAFTTPDAATYDLSTA